jgi:hypothetical protein
MSDQYSVTKTVTATTGKITHAAIFDANPPKRRWWKFWQRKSALIAVVVFDQEDRDDA